MPLSSIASPPLSLCSTAPSFLLPSFCFPVSLALWLSFPAGLTPALACAPSREVADCLALILATMMPFCSPCSSGAPSPGIPAEISALPGQEPPRPPQSKGPLRSLQRGHDHRKRLGLRDILTPAPFRCAGHSFQSTYCHEPNRSCTDFWLWSTASVTRDYVIKHIWYAFVLPHLFALEIFSKAILITLTQVDWWWIAKCWLTSHTWRMMM